MNTNAKKKMTFDLNEEMLKTLGAEFDVQQLAKTFAQAIKNKNGDALGHKAEEIFTHYGQQWMKRAMELGEAYSDTTYETLKKAITKTGSLFFPMVPQRFVEIAYLSTQSIFSLPIVQNNGEKFSFKLAMCDTFKAIKETCGQEIANTLPCRFACLGALETVFSNLNIPVAIGMDATMPKDDYCQFSAAKT
jgi:hypothetical protein